MADYESVVFRGEGTAVTFFFSFSWSNIQDNVTQTFTFLSQEEGLCYFREFLTL